MGKKSVSTITANQLLEDAAPKSNIDLTQIIKLATEMIQLELRLAKWAEEAKKLKDRHDAIQNEVLPELMIAAGMEEFSLEGGLRLVCEKVLQANIPSMTKIEDTEDADERQQLKERRAAAFAWLRKNKAAAIIRATLKADFGAGHTKEAKTFFAQITKAGFKVSQDENVHPQTLNKFLREKIEQGADVPSDVFAIYNGNRARLVQPKAKKGVSA